MVTSNPQRSFASDNNSGVHPKVMQALAAANCGHCVAYGDDPFTRSADEAIRREFGEGAEAWFVFGGTGANVSGLSCITQSWHGIVCARSAHINRDECGAPEKFTGCKLLAVDHDFGRIHPDSLDQFQADVGFEHHNQPRVLSLTQCTELGAVYTLDELRDLCDKAHGLGWKVHMDGARLANAAVALDCSLADTSRAVGVDVLSLGGCKNGLMFGEAVVFFDPSLARDFRYVRKQSMQLYSKMRFIAVQFEALLTDGLWRENASKANAMAKLLAERASAVPGVEITAPVQTNAVFARLPGRVMRALREQWFFYVWDPADNVARWMTSFDTTEADVEAFTRSLAEAAGG